MWTVEPRMADHIAVTVIGALVRNATATLTVVGTRPGADGLLSL